MKKQPAMKIPKSSFAKLLDWVTILIFITAIIYLITQFPVLPVRVPGHYDGEDLCVLFMPIFLVVIFGSMIIFMVRMLRL